jgi:hypothetical protein
MTLSDANAGYARSRIQGANGHVGLMTEAYIGSGGANPGAGLLFLENGSGKLGIGTGYPTAKLDVRGHLTLDPGVSPTLYTAASGGEQNRYLQLINSPSSPSASGLKAGGILVADSYSYANPGKNDLVAKGNITAGGNMSCKVLTVTGADVAEKFPSNEERVEPGTVMEIDPEHAGKLRVAREPYSSRVAGVVSGAGDLPAGAVLGSSPGNEDAPAIALTGRVWVQCDAAGAAIAAGDLLTTSSNPGFAMKASDRERSHGAVLGKAMTTLAQGDRGLVLVLVNLQ